MLLDRPFGIELPGLFIPFESKGTKIYFRSRAPTAKELATCQHIDVTSKVPWNPHEIHLAEVQADASFHQANDPRSSEYEIRSLDPLLDSSLWRQVQQLQYNPQSLDVPSRPTFASSERHAGATPEELSERWGISTDRARATLHATLQRSTRSALLPLARRYRADRRYEKPLLRGKFWTYTAYFKCNSQPSVLSQMRLLRQLQSGKDE